MQRFSILLARRSVEARGAGTWRIGGLRHWSRRIPVIFAARRPRVIYSREHLAPFAGEKIPSADDGIASAEEKKRMLPPGKESDPSEPGEAEHT
mmetsp:Transcript_15841/g.64750  ORF Transcript_15841/g.64750 Transcript_15841/m.64750 type:complete len:94 (+) Transcript_15841:150-431(+)